MRHVLALRRDMPGLFATGSYGPISLPGEERLLGFWREGEGARLLVLADLSGRRRAGPVPHGVPDARTLSAFPGGADGREGIAAALAADSVFIGLCEG